MSSNSSLSLNKNPFSLSISALELMMDHNRIGLNLLQLAAEQRKISPELPLLLGVSEGFLEQFAQQRARYQLKEASSFGMPLFKPRFSEEVLRDLVQHGFSYETVVQAVTRELPLDLIKG
jgi:SOS response regulatory protein OraA/RecX